MKNSINRRKFLHAAAIAGATLPFTNPLAALSQEKQKNKKGPPLLQNDVREFVGAAHSDFDAVQRMLEEQPALANAAWDWGGGDWETGLGAAAHMGRKDIAVFLLNNNARVDIFAAAMLGRLAVVKTMAQAFPGIHKVPGPHKIPLIVHAEKGGEEARSVLEFLRTLESA